MGNQEARPARREVLAGILAAGAALGLSNQQASAITNPVAGAKSKANEAVESAKNVAASNPLGDVQGAVGEAGAGLQRRIDGLFGKNKVRIDMEKVMPVTCITESFILNSAIVNAYRVHVDEF